MTTQLIRNNDLCKFAVGAGRYKGVFVDDDDIPVYISVGGNSNGYSWTPERVKDVEPLGNMCRVSIDRLRNEAHKAVDQASDQDLVTFMSNVFKNKILFVKTTGKEEYLIIREEDFTSPSLTNVKEDI